MKTEDLEQWVRDTSRMHHLSRRERKRLGIDTLRVIRKNKGIIHAYNKDLRKTLVPFYHGPLRIKGVAKVRRVLKDRYMVFDMYLRRWVWPTPLYQCTPSMCPRLTKFIAKTGLDRSKTLTFIWKNSVLYKKSANLEDKLL